MTEARPVRRTYVGSYGSGVAAIGFEEEDARRSAQLDAMIAADKAKRAANPMTKIRRHSCTVRGCPREHMAKGLCSLHYARKKYFASKARA